MRNNAKTVIGSMLLCILAHSTSVASVVIDMTTIGNTGNQADTTGYGSVAYQYQIGTYEITNAQYADFLNSVAQSDPNNLYHTDMGASSQGGITRSGEAGSYVYTVKAGFENKPVNFVSFADAARFANWQTNSSNGQGISTETGAYDLSLSLTTVTRMTLQPGQTVQYFVASEDEWYKAAYFDPTLNGGLGGYWDYATQSNTAPTASGPTNLANHANYNNAMGAAGNNVEVGSYPSSSSYYGTFDQEGNLGEITDTITGSNRVRRGAQINSANVGSGYSTSDAPTTEGRALGFRIVMVTVPEPSSALLIGGSVVALGFLRRQRKSLK
jgi:sulfatase modifying factor 1